MIKPSPMPESRLEPPRERIPRKDLYPENHKHLFHLLKNPSGPPQNAQRRTSRADTNEIVEEIYEELRKLAAHFMLRERRNHTLQPTAVVHEVYLRLARESRLEWKGRAHFRAIAIVAIRKFLVDYARRTLAEKRGAAWSRITLSPDLITTNVSPQDMLSLDAALERLSNLDARQARVVELRFFGGLSIEESAELLGVSPRTVAGAWRIARAWLKRELAVEADKH